MLNRPDHTGRFSKDRDDVRSSNEKQRSMPNRGDEMSQRFSSTMPQISLPRGGGAIRGIEEKFQVNAVTGTSSFSLPIPFSPSRGGGLPPIGLSYNSGSGNSEFGLGWTLTVPSIKRKTEKRLPQYRDDAESDTFTLSGMEDLVPLLEAENGKWVGHVQQRTVSGGSYTIRKYRPRIEGLFARIELWKNDATGEIHWRTISRDNVHSYFGLTGESRLVDPDDSTRVFEWKLCRVHDDKGSITLYTYKKEDFAGIAHNLNEKNRVGRCTQSYLKKVLYGNITPYYLGDEIPDEDDFMFKSVLDYGEHDPAENIPKTVDEETTDWICRKDPFSSYRSGFEIRTYRRCSRILMFHCFKQELPHTPYLVKSLQLFYDDDLDYLGSGQKSEGFSNLVTARQNGHIWDDQATHYTTRYLPELELTYQQHEWNTEVKTVRREDSVEVPAGLMDRSYLWVDLFSEGISGILTEQPSGLYYKRNLGDGRFERARPVSPRPSFSGLSDGKVAIQELESDGTKHLVYYAGEPRGAFELSDDDEWQPLKNFTAYPTTALADPDTRLIDLDGDGLPDLLRTEENTMLLHLSEGMDGFEVSRRVWKAIDEEKGPAILFSDQEQSIFLADMSGDGLTDIVRIRNGEVCYWPNLGYGRFGAKIGMDNAPLFDHPGSFNPRFLRLADIDGSGTMDIVYLGKNDFRVWINQNGNEWMSKPHIISAFPAVHDLADVAVLDLLGSGTACIVYSTILGTDPMWYIDLMGSTKPHLFIGYKNNCGLEVSLEYKSSTHFYLEDRKAGRPWISKLPFPVHCIAKTIVEDKVRETVFTTSYSYHHGYFDHQEREFRGFARVEQYDTEDFAQFSLNEAKNVVQEDLHQPPVKTISWFHTGAYVRNLKILHQCESEYFTNAVFAEHDLPEPFFPQGLTTDELREAYRACKGLPLRTEVYAEDGTERSPYPYSISESTFEVRLLQPTGENENASFLVIPSESIAYGYERNVGDPRISHSLVLAADELGNITQSASVSYPRVSRPVAPNEIPDDVWNEQNKLHIGYGESLFTNDIDQDDTYRLRAAYEGKSYELSGIMQPQEVYFSKQGIAADIVASTEILFEVDFTTGLQKCLIGHRRGYFLKDDLSGPLALGELSSLAIAYKSYMIAFTEGLVTRNYGSKVTEGMLVDGQYVHSEGDNNWWTQSGIALYSSSPPDDFYTPIGGRDVFGNDGYVELDGYKLLPIGLTDAIGNKIAAVNDYRTLSPAIVTDPNMNRAAVETDELGMVVKSVLMGKEGAGEGDTIDDPTARIEYDLFNWKNMGKPNYAHSFMRERHGASNPRWQEGYVYSDGAGNVVMAKAQAEPGKAKRWNAETGEIEEVDADPRWIGNGRTIVNNKGNPVKKYDSFFSTTFEYEGEAALVECGMSPLLHYDPLGRNTRTEFPNSTFSKVEFESWRSNAYDVNDTVRDSKWYLDRGSPDPLSAEPTDSEQRAAWLAAKHHDTPSTMYSDSLGRTIQTVVDFGEGKTTTVRSEMDLAGRYSKIYDQFGRMVAESYVNMLGATIYGKSAERGEQWVLVDVLGHLVRVWENDTREMWATYDTLHRPVSSYARENGTDYLFAHLLYGDLISNADQLNLKGRAYQIYDQSGVVTLTDVDFKGNVLGAERKLTKEYKQVVNWSALSGLSDISAIEAASSSLLETEGFTSEAQLDALNRPILVTLPDGSVVRPTFNEANYLDKLEVQVRGEGEFITFLENQDYDAKGQRQYAEFGNGLITNYFYDPQTFRLVNLMTKRLGTGDSQAVQNLFYTFDPVGNIVFSKDDSQQTHFFQNEIVKPENLFQYDAVYQLISAAGREHGGLGGGSQRDNNDLPYHAQLPHANDTSAVRTYTEEYEYDDCSNIKQIQHIATDANWTRRYRYHYEDDASDLTNRLKSTSMPGDPEGGPYTATYTHDARGNMTSMPHLSAADSLIWNFMDQLKQVDLGGGGTVYYVYGIGGGRVRKVIERQGGLRIERLYLGAVEIYREFQGSDKQLERNTLHVSDNIGPIAQVDTKLLDLDNSDPANPLNTDLVRYQFANHLGSATLETDDEGIVISYEEYHPYGTSAYRSSKSDVDLSLKRYRFSGKERDDETGFYYFGARYYAAWLGRWTSSDPAGHVSGLNLFQYCSDNPIMFHDPNGMQETMDRRFGLPDWASLPENATKADIAATGLRLQQHATQLGYEWSRSEASNPNPEYDPQAGSWTFGVFTTIPPDDPLGILGECRPPEVQESETDNSTPDEGGTGGGDPGVGGITGGEPSSETPTVSKDSDYVGEPGFWESLIPIWGSGRESINHFQHGNYWRGTFWGALAVTDVFLVKSLVMGAGKLAIRTTVSLTAKEGEVIVARATIEGLEHAPSLTLSHADTLASRASSAEWKALGSRFEPGAQIAELEGGWWVKRVDPSSAMFRQHWGAMSIEAQERGLIRLGDMSTQFFIKDGMLFTRSVGATGPSVFSRTFANGFFRGSYRMGTLLNDIRPRNMGINGVIFDPALDPFIQSIFMTGTAGAVRIPVIYVELQEP